MSGSLLDVQWTTVAPKLRESRSEKGQRSEGTADPFTREARTDHFTGTVTNSEPSRR